MSQGDATVLDVSEVLARHPVLSELGTLFERAGHELALVGGPVRDLLLGRAVTDLDVTTSARPEQIEQVVAGWADAVWDVGREFGTIGLRKGDETVELTTYRTDEYDPTSRKPQVAFGETLEADLSRRDFTVNALAVRLPSGEFVDAFGGVPDLAVGRLRTPVTAEQSFDDDPLRMMRAARFVAQLGFTAADDVVAAMSDMAERLSIVSAERVRDELVKLVLGRDPVSGLRLLVQTGLADHVLPELPALRLERDEHHRHKDVYEHSLTVLEQAIDLEHRLGTGGGAGPGAADSTGGGAGPGAADSTGGGAGPGAANGADFVVRFAALVHDIGKPRTRRFLEDGSVTFHHHDVVGAKMTRKRMRALRFSNDVTDAVATLVELHLRFHGYGSGEWTDSAVRRYVRDAGDQLERLHILTRADCTTRNQRKAARLRRSYDDLERRIAELSEAEELAAIRPDLDGNQIMAVLGIGPGREVGEAYRFLLDLRMDRGPLDEDEAVAALKAWWAARP